MGGKDTFPRAEMTSAYTLESNGIALDVNAGVSDLRLEGSAPSDRMTLLLKALLTLSRERSADPQAYSLFKREEKLRALLPAGREELRMSVLDSIVAPGSLYSTYRDPSVLTDGYPDRVSRYLDSQFSRMNDGVFIIVGDLDEEAVKAKLCSLLGGFSTDKVSSARTRTRFQAISGRKTVVRKGSESSIDLCFTSEVDYSVENIFASKVVAARLEKAVRGAAAMCGWSTSGFDRFDMFPQERLYVGFNLTPADIEGMPASMIAKDSVETVLEAVRKAVQDVSRSAFSDADASRAQKFLSDQSSSWKSDPSYMVRMLTLRYSYGKDMLTRQDEKIKAVTKDRLSTMLRSLCEGGVAEYAVQGPIIPEKVDEGNIPPAPRPAALDTIKTPVVLSDPDGIGALYRELFENER